MDWYHGLPCTLDWRQCVNDEDEKLYIRAVPAGQLVLLDSGADISLLPYHLSGCRIPKPGGKTVLEMPKDLHVWSVKVLTTTLW